MLHAYELDHSTASFLRGYWLGYHGRPMGNVCKLARAEYQHGYATGLADYNELKQRWAQYEDKAPTHYAPQLAVA